MTWNKPIFIIAALLLTATHLFAEGISGDSIYNLESEWKNQDNITMRMADLQGKPQVLAMAYTSCPHVCPLIINDMQQIDQELSSETSPNVGLVIVSIDPARDTPEQLKSYAKKRGLDPNRWTLLTGDEDSILELAAVLGFKYKEVAGGDFSHSNLINIIDQEGVLVHQQVGLKQDPKESAAQLKKLF